MRLDFIFIMNSYFNEFSRNSRTVMDYMMTLMFFEKNKIQIQWNSVLLICLSLIIFIPYLYVKKNKLKKIKNGLKLIHEQYLYQSLLPADFYKVSDLNCLNIKMNHLLFSHKSIYLIQSLNLRGQLGGDMYDWTLNIHQASSVKTIKNPIRLLTRKELVIKELMALYEVSLPIQSYYVYDGQKLKLHLTQELNASKFIKQQEFKLFLEHILKEDKNRICQEDDLQNILYFIISMRYLEYLKRFYYELSLVDKVQLSSVLIQDSKQLLSFFVSSSIITMDKIHQFQRRYFNKQSKSLKVLQTKLFDELRDWALVHPTIEFMTFNEDVLIFSEGFERPQSKKSNVYAL